MCENIHVSSKSIEKNDYDISCIKVNLDTSKFGLYGCFVSKGGFVGTLFVYLIFGEICESVMIT